MGGRGNFSGGTTKVYGSKIAATKGNPNSKIVRYNFGKKVQERYFDWEGRAEYDMIIHTAETGNMNFHINTLGIGQIHQTRKGANMRIKIKKNCDVCGNEMISYEYGGKKCKVCGWIDDPHQLEYPNCSNANNMISLLRARELWKEHKKFLPTYEESLSLIDRGFDLVIQYKGQEYLLEKFNGEIYIVNNAQNMEVSYNDIHDFEKNAKIEDELLSEIWDKITFIEYGF